MADDHQSPSSSRPRARRRPKQQRRRPERPGPPRAAVRVTPELLEEAAQALASGITLSAWCREPGHPSRQSVVCAVRRAGPEMQERWRQAREEGYDVLAEEVLELADREVPRDDRGRVDTGAVQQRRLQADVRLRLLAKWCTARYGDRVQVAGDPDAPIGRMTDQQVMEEVLGLVARAKSRQLAAEAGDRLRAHELGEGLN